MNKQKIKSENDSAFIQVPLHDFKSNKILILEVGGKAKIFLSGDSILWRCASREKLSISIDSEFKKEVNILNSAFETKDTAIIEFRRIFLLQYVVSEQLKLGNAKVYCKREKIFVDSIFHQLERFAGNADRFFYLPDKRPFFFVSELTGIIDKNYNPFSTNRQEEYQREVEKMLNTFKE